MLACQYSKYNCKGLERPVIVYSKIMLDAFGHRYAGIHYSDEKYVFILPHYVGMMRQITTVHEIVHYLNYAVGSPDNRCESEAEARATTDRIGMELGVPANTLDGDKWRASYGCVTPVL